jgi:hypothetical protein
MRHHNEDFVKSYQKVSVRTVCAGKISKIFERVKR